MMFLESMNIKQVSYLVNRYANKIAIPLLGAGAFAGGRLALKDFGQFEDVGDLGIVLLEAAICGYLAGTAIRTATTAISSSRKKRMIDENPELYPLENVSEIFMRSSDLEMLLDRTSNSEHREWGTYLVVEYSESKAYVHHSISPENAEDVGLISARGIDGLKSDKGKGAGLGFNASHHYHPTFISKKFGGMNFSINPADKNSPLDWINLLTFNMEDGPEIVGYNHKHIYLPLGKDKFHLVRATHNDIMRYLA